VLVAIPLILLALATAAVAALAVLRGRRLEQTRDAVVTLARAWAEDGSSRGRLCGAAVHAAGARLALLAEPTARGDELVITATAEAPDVTGMRLPLDESFSPSVRAFLHGEPIHVADVERSAEAAPARQVPRPEGAPDCPKCKLEGREGFLVEREGAAGKFLACSQGREACGYLSDAPKNAKQRKALLQTACHACGGAMRLRLPKEKSKRPFLSCLRYPECRGARGFDEQGALEEARAAPETGPPCALCQTPTVKRGPATSGSYFWSCTRWRSDGSGCNARPVWINERAG
jgi:ssDNA-binding Zn-finger/Zn-ribbon topoisomerase 1